MLKVQHLIVMRHGAYISATSDLDAKGELQARHAADTLLQTFGKTSVTILTSSKLRAEHTGRIIADKLETLSVITNDALTDNRYNERWIFDQIRSCDWPLMLLITHTPLMSELIAAVTHEFLGTVVQPVKDRDFFWPCEMVDIDLTQKTVTLLPHNPD